jgi:hypothetical protein
MLALFAFFALNALLVEVKLRRLRAGRRRDQALVSPRTMGHLLGAVMLVLVVRNNFDAGVAAFNVKAFGVSPHGIPVAWLVTSVQALLFAPFLWVLGHLVEVASQARRDGAAMSKVGLMTYLVEMPQTHPQLRRSRVIVLGGLGYFVALVAGWIAYTSARGL